MATRRINDPISLSLLDRLMDEGRQESIGSLRPIDQLRMAVRRDIEWLLNSRQPAEGVPEGLTELRRSVYNYGLPDITSLNLSSPEGRAALVRSIETALHLFEPRLANIRVSLHSVSGEKSPQVRFTVEGVLRVDPAPQPVAFDTLLEVTSGEYKVQG
jgi:type VI secretion system protein ImpF